MQGYSPKLPLVYDPAEDGLYSLNKNLLETIKQNLKMLLLTNPGERIMDSKYGVGMRRYLFEQNTPIVKDAIRAKIVEQVKKYLNYIEIDDLTIVDGDNTEENLIFVTVRYSVPSLNVNDELNIIP